MSSKRSFQTFTATIPTKYEGKKRRKNKLGAENEEEKELEEKIFNALQLISEGKEEKELEETILRALLQTTEESKEEKKESKEEKRQEIKESKIWVCLGPVIGCAEKRFDELKPNEKFWPEYIDCNIACGTVPGLRELTGTYLAPQEVTMLRTARMPITQGEVEENKLLKLCDVGPENAIAAFDAILDMIRHKQGLGAIPELIDKLLDYNNGCFGVRDWNYINLGIAPVYEMIITIDNILAANSILGPVRLTASDQFGQIPWSHILRHLYHQYTHEYDNYEKINIFLKLFNMLA